MGDADQGRTGPLYSTDGTIASIRLSRLGSQTVADGHAHFYEAVRLGGNPAGAYAACTPASGCIPTALSAAFGVGSPMVLYNPKSSGRLLLPWSITYGIQASGTVVGAVWHLVAQNNPAANAVTGDQRPVQNNLIGGPQGVGQLFTMATLPAVPVGLRPSWTVSPSAFPYGGGAPYLMKDYLDGEYGVAPGCALGLNLIGQAAAGTLTWMLGMSWEEVPI